MVRETRNPCSTDIHAVVVDIKWSDCKTLQVVEMGVATLRKSKAKKTVAEALLRDMQGTAAEKLALFEKLKARGGFAGEDRAELLRVERTLRTFAATEK